MEQESTSNKRVCIIGSGPSGCICAKLLQNKFDVTVFDNGNFLRTLLPTGGGRCNLAHAQYDFKELAKNYPRGEKFLYSIFSKFSTSDTLEFFKSIGVKTYAQDDNRIFPVSNSSKDVREKLLKSLKKCRMVKEKATDLRKINNGWEVTTQKSKYLFDYVIAAIGGHSGYDLFKNLDIKIIPPTQSLTGLVTKEDFTDIAGVSVNDVLFTHKGVSGPYIYKLSAINARKEFPYKISFNLVDCDNLQELLNQNPHKEIKNLVAQMIPKSLAHWILTDLNIPDQTPCHKIDGKMRDKIVNKLKNFEITITGKVAEDEIVTCGGVELNEVNPKTLESKKYEGLYFCGEVLDIDGFCGGFNLQNCWSTGFVCASSIINRG